MPLFDFRCPLCEVTVERLVRREKQTVTCEHCGTTMIQQPAAPGFTITGFNAKNGYSKE